MNYQQTRDSFPFVNVGNVYVGKILNDCGRVEVIFLLKSHIVRNYGHMRFEPSDEHWIEFHTALATRPNH